jgi:hypothetical protein
MHVPDAQIAARHAPNLPVGSVGEPRAAIRSMTKKDEDETRTYRTVLGKEKGTGPGSAGQSGDTQGLSDLAEAGSESVEELVEEGQFLEAEVISGVENAPDADEGEVRTKQVPEDDVPAEYLGQD